MRPLGCASPGRGRAGFTRGCCHRHYKRLAARVRAGEATWDQLEAAGERRPPNPDALRRYRAGRGLLASRGQPS
jgi:hypothetical protein